MIDRPSPGLAAPDGASSTWVGVNSWSRAGGPRMWSAAFDAGVVREELRVLADHFAAALPGADPEATWRLYRALAGRAGVERAVGADAPEVLVDRLLHRDGACYVWAVDTGDGPRSPRIELCGGGWLQDVESGERVDAEVGLPPYMGCACSGG